LAGVECADRHPLRAPERAALIVALAALGLLIGLGLTGCLHFEPVAMAQAMAIVILAVGALFFAGLFGFGGLDPTEKRRVGVILILFVASALFWAGFEQAGSSFNLFAQRHTDRTVPWLHFILPATQRGLEVPAGWYQSLGAVFIILFAPVFAAFWVWLARRNLDPAMPVKFGLGLLLLAGGFLVMAGAAHVVVGGGKAQPTWLVATYLLHTFGELCLSPVGLSSVTKLAPRRYVGQLMGTWFLATSLGNLIAGMLAGEFKADLLPSWPAMYLKLLLVPAVAGTLLILLARPIQRWVGRAR
jgi:POT family proton-dependent oligopeptide transporter